MEAAILAEIEKMTDEIVEVLCRMVAAPSFNPPGDTREVAGVVAEWLASRGIAARYWDKGHHRSVLARVEGALPGPTLVFSSHLDTVGIGDGAWLDDPFSGCVREGRVYGRGCADAKGPVVAMCAAAIALNRVGGIGRGVLVVNPVADEETGAVNGTVALLDEGVIEPDLCIVGEITGNRVATAEKGVMDVTLTTRGATAHASTPWDGVNAIDSMVKLIGAVRGEFDRRFAHLTHHLTPPPTMNVGTIRGGVRSNVVPDSCEAVLDFRIIPGMGFEGIVSMVEAEVARLAHCEPGFRAEVAIGRQQQPYETRGDAGLTVTALSVCADLGMEAQPIGFRQCSDGTFYARRGVPTIIFGPGEPEMAHAPNESIRVDDVVTAAKAFALMAHRALA